MYAEMSYIADHDDVVVLVERPDAKRLIRIHCGSDITLAFTVSEAVELVDGVAAALAEVDTREAVQ